MKKVTNLVDDIKIIFYITYDSKRETRSSTIIFDGNLVFYFWENDF